MSQVERCCHVCSQSYILIREFNTLFTICANLCTATLQSDNQLECGPSPNWSSVRMFDPTSVYWSEQRTEICCCLTPITRENRFLFSSRPTSVTLLCFPRGTQGVAQKSSLATLVLIVALHYPRISFDCTPVPTCSEFDFDRTPVPTTTSFSSLDIQQQQVSQA